MYTGQFYMGSALKLLTYQMLIKVNLDNNKNLSSQ